MITCKFGVPGVGKTTDLCRIAQKELRRMRKGSSAYKHILTNFYCEGCEKIDFNDLGKYKMEYCLILLDELTLDADSRDYKSFSQQKKVFFTLHRHLKCDIVYFVQDFSRVDKHIRNLTYDLWYMTRSVVPIARNFTVSRRIFRQISINQYSGELILGYRFPKTSERLFTSCFQITRIGKWHKYFDSYDCRDFDRLPEYEYQNWNEPQDPDVDLTGTAGLLDYIEQQEEEAINDYINL